MEPQKIRNWVTFQNGLDKLELRETIMPEPGDGEVLVKVHTVSLNYRDTEVCMGLYGHHKTISQDIAALVPCSDMCGTVNKLGSNVTSLKPNDRVLSIFNQTHLTGQVQESDMASGLGLPLQGVLAEYKVLSAASLVLCPEYLTDEEACTLPIAAVTAWMSINWMQPIGSPVRDPATTVLVQGTGGVSIAGLQIAKALGLQVIVTSSSDEKLAKARSLGAIHTINYVTTPAWSTRVLSLTNNAGADIIFECGGAHTLRQSFECVAFGGLISSIGYLSGKGESADGEMNVNVMALKRNVTVKGILNGPRERFVEVLGVYAEQRVRPVVDRVFGFEEAGEALGYLYGGKHFGKVVVRVDS